jgi:hypothetical protein
MLYPIARIAVFVAACGAAVASMAQTVTPPPLPPGSNLVRPEAGMAEPERKRHVRAHHHKMHNKRDYTRDDSIHGPETEVAAQPAAQRGMGAAPGQGAAGTVQDGRGTGPAREKTDKGASGYFYGNDKK